MNLFRYVYGFVSWTIFFFGAFCFAKLACGDIAYKPISELYRAMTFGAVFTYMYADGFPNILIERMKGLSEREKNK